MLTQHRRKLEKLQKLLDEMQSLVKEILVDETDSSGRQRNKPAFDAEAFLVNIRNLDRAHVEGLLLERSYRELGAIFVAAGGTSVDSKKPKDWLVNQILWRIFDFQRGHEAIRTPGGQDG
jgi:hypothetical protein